MWFLGKVESTGVIKSYQDKGTDEEKNDKSSCRLKTGGNMKVRIYSLCS